MRYADPLALYCRLLSALLRPAQPRPDLSRPPAAPRSPRGPRPVRRAQPRGPRGPPPAAFDEDRTRDIELWRRRAVALQSARNRAAGMSPEEDLEDRAAVAYAVRKYVARRRCVNVLHTLASDKAQAGTLESCMEAIDAMRRLSQVDSSAYMLVAHGGIQAALDAMTNYARNADVQWHACTLFGNLALSLVLLVRVHKHPEIRNGRTMLLIIRALMNFQKDVRVQAAGCGALWTLVMAVGTLGQQLAVQAGAVPLLIATVREFGDSGVCVYNACGALLTIAQGLPAVQRALHEEGATALVREAIDRHGGIEQMYGQDIANLSRWIYGEMVAL